MKCTFALFVACVSGWKCKGEVSVLAPKPCENLGIIAAENHEMVQISFLKY